MHQEFETCERTVVARCLPTAAVQIFGVQGRTARALTAGEGPDVVLLPGGSVPAAAWLPLMADLDGWRLHALELPGFCGPSDPLELRPGTLRQEAVRFVTGSLDALGLQSAAFIANSMGALWAIWFALEHPGRVQALITMGCPALLPGTSAPTPMRLLSVRPLGRLMMRLTTPSAAQVDKVLAGVGVDLSEWPELRDLVVTLERIPHYPSSWLDLLHAALRLDGARSGAALTEDELAALSQPVQMIWGADDPFGSMAHAERAAGLIPDVELHVVPGGHSPWLAPGAEADRLASDFLRRRTSMA